MANSRYINNLVCVSDLHCGCRVGLYPCSSALLLDMGIEYIPSNFQKKVWEFWEEFWGEWIQDVCHNEPFDLVINGDGVDGDHHQAKTQVSLNVNDQRRIAQAALRPALQHPLFHGLYWIRGTEAHVGSSAEHEEAVAESLNAIKDQDDQYSRQELWVRVGGPQGALCHFMHHIGTTSRSQAESTAINAEMTEMFVEAGRWGEKAADVVVRSHRHRYIEVRAPSMRGYTIACTTPGWQGKTPFAYRIPGARQTNPQFGGISIRRGDHEHYTRSFVKSVQRAPEIVLQEAL